MAAQNRVTPLGDIDAFPLRGAFTGNRGRLHDGCRIVRFHAGDSASERAVENLLTVVGEDLACTVDLEYVERIRDGRTYHRVLRCTQVYRLEDKTWKVIVRHADELPERDPLQR